AVSEIRAAARDLRGVRTTRIPIVLDGDPAVAAREAVPEGYHPPRTAEVRPRFRLAEAAPVHRAPHEPCGERVLCLALSGGGGAYHGRGRRVVHGLLGDRTRQGSDHPE